MAPYEVNQVLVDSLVYASLFLDLVGELPGIGSSHYGWVYCYHLAALGLIGCPLLDGGDILYALLQQLPIAVQLLLSLVKVAAVGRESSLVLRDDSVTG